MTRLFATILMLASTSMVFAQDYIIPLREVKKSSAISQSVNIISSIKMQFAIDALYGVSVETKEHGKFIDMYFGKGYATGSIGEPKLPAFKRLIQIPHNATVSVQVNGYSQQDISLVDFGINTPIYPNQPSVRKDQDLEQLPFHYNKQSYVNAHLSENPQVQVNVLGTLRGIRIALLQVNPLQYNPISGTVRVFNDIDVEIITHGGSKDFENDIHTKTFSQYFDPVFGALANPYTKDVYDEHPDLTKYPTKMQVVSPRIFEEKLQPFIQWKTEKGFYVDVAYTDEIGETASEIKAYIHSKYNSYAQGDIPPTFLVLVGDVEQLPASAIGTKSGRKTDLYYASVDGDQFPEMYYGRLSAETPNELENIVSKIIYYEKYQFSTPSYLNNATLIAGVDASWNPRVGEPTVKYATKNYFNSAMGFSTIWGYGVESDPNNPNNSSGYSGSYDPERISVGFINYTAHCNQTSWAEPRLDASQIVQFSNTQKYPFVIGNCCESADFGFTSGISVGESWIRGKDKGAVTYIGSSPNTYWFEDFYWSVGAFPIQGTNDGYVPTFDESSFGAYDAAFHTEYLSAAGLMFIGNLSVTEAHLESYNTHSSPLYYWEAYNVLGDPSLIPFFTEAEVNSVDHSEMLPIGVSDFQVQALPGSYVSISKGAKLHGAALVGPEGSVNVPIEPVLEGGDVSIVITRPQTQPYFAYVPAAVLGEAYVTLMEYSINDPSGNNNSQADYGEEFTIDIYLKNVGDQESSEVSISFVGTDDYFNLISSSIIPGGIFGNQLDNSSKNIEDAFTIQLSNDVPNGHKATFTLEISDGSNIWKSIFELTALAPFIQLGEVMIQDEGTGTENHLDPGENANLSIEILNTGASAINDITVGLTTTSDNVSIGIENQIINTLEAGTNTTLNFPVSAKDNVPLETLEILNLKIEPQAYGFEHELELMVGKLPEIWMGTTDSVTTCLARFYDSGGPEGDYSDNEDYIMTIYPETEGYAISAQFNYALIEGEQTLWDKLFIYDGIDTTSSYFTGSPFSNSNGTDIGSLTATNPYGAITFYFSSDGSVVYKGWEALITCIVPEYTATFIVNNTKDERIVNAAIQIKGIDQEFVTNVDGEILTVLRNGNYSFTAQAEGYHIYKSTFQVAGRDVTVPIQLVVVGVEEHRALGVEVFPNPFGAFLKVSGTEKANKLIITNILGQRLIERSISGEHSVTIPTSSLPQGVYVLSLIINENDIRSTKIIKH